MHSIHLYSRWLLLGGVLMLAGGTPALHAEESARDRELRRLLAKPVQFPGIEDPKTTFSEVLEQFAKHYNLSFDLNERALEKAKITKSDRLEILTRGPVPEMRTRLSKVFKLILRRVSPSAAYLIRDDKIEITTKEAIREEFFADRPHGPFPPLVSCNFEKVPLETALKELAHEGNIVLDTRAGKEGHLPVTAEMANVPLDTVVRVLADMAGLAAVQLDNVLYVTAKDNARALMMEEQAKRRPPPKDDTK